MDELIKIEENIANLNDAGIEDWYYEFPVDEISLKEMVVKKDLEHIQMTEVPKAYFTTIESRNGGKLTFYSNLL